MLGVFAWSVWPGSLALSAFVAPRSAIADVGVGQSDGVGLEDVASGPVGELVGIERTASVSVVPW